MRVYREILKYLDSYVVDRIILTEFNPETLDSEWKNYSPTLNDVNRTIYNNAVQFANIVADKPLLLEMLYIERLDDRSTLEVDILSSTELQPDDLEISLCEGYNINSPKLILKNSDTIPANTLKTVSFNINNSITKRMDNLANIKTISFNFKKDVANLVIGKVDAYNPEYSFTIENIMDYYKRGLKYVLSGLGRPELPNNENLMEAVYQASASYMWMKKEGKDAKYGNSQNYSIKLLKDADKAIAEYKNDGAVSSNPYSNIKKLGGFRWSRVQ